MAATVVPTLPLRLAPPRPASLVVRLGYAFAAAGRAWQARRAARTLAGFDARMLADIGVGPGEIEAAVRDGRRRPFVPGRPFAPTLAPTLPPSFTEWR